MITPYYAKNGIVIYRAKAGEIISQLDRGKFGTLVFDPPFSPTLEEIISKLRWIRPGGKILVFGPNGYSIMPQSESSVVEMKELAPRPELGHPVARPIEAVKKVIELTEGAILDPYMGVGSTLIAARMLNREATGVELEEKYCRIAVARLQGLQ